LSSACYYLVSLNYLLELQRQQILIFSALMVLVGQQKVNPFVSLFSIFFIFYFQRLWICIYLWISTKNRRIWIWIWIRTGNFICTATLSV